LQAAARLCHLALGGGVTKLGQARYLFGWITPVALSQPCTGHHMRLPVQARHALSHHRLPHQLFVPNLGAAWRAHSRVCSASGFREWLLMSQCSLLQLECCQAQRLEMLVRRAGGVGLPTSRRGRAHRARNGKGCFLKEAGCRRCAVPELLRVVFVCVLRAALCGVGGAAAELTRLSE
jgi:hypothetical protein